MDIVLKPIVCLLQHLFQIYIYMTFLRAQMVKNLPAMGRYGFDSWVGKIPWRRNGNPLGILAWRIPRTEDPGRLQSMRSQRVRHEDTTE